jgi:hypothetical protein
VVSSVHPTRQQLDELDALLQRMLDLPVNRVEDKEADKTEAAPPASPPATAPLPRPLSLPRLARLTPPAPAARGAETTAGAKTPKTPEPSFPPAQEGMNEANKDTLEIKEKPGEQEPEQSSGTLPLQPPHRMRKRTPPPQSTAGPEEGAEGGDGDWVPFRSSWKPSPHTWPPLAESWAQAQQSSDGARVRRDEPAVEPSKDAKAAPAPTTAARPASAKSENIVYPRPLFGSSPQPALSETRTLQTDIAPRVEEAPGELSWWLRTLVTINRTFDAAAARAGKPGAWLLGDRGRTTLGVLGVVCTVGALGLIVAGWLGWTW